jgi:ATP-dependent RNA helicase RhlE
MSIESSSSAASFSGLGIAPRILETLARLKLTTPTPIQAKSIPVALEGSDLLGIAQTGTGKTLAFTIPMVQRLAQGQRDRGLVLVPTRELALQVEKTVRDIAYPFGMRTAVLIGGASMYNQVGDLRRNPAIIIATPGRLMDHLEQKTCELFDTRALVLDEADRMLDMGFQPQVERILRTVPKDRQTMLFSATMPESILKLTTSYMKLPVRIEIAPQGTAAEKVQQELFIVRQEAKEKLLIHILEEHAGSVLLFMRTKHHARKLTRNLRDRGFTAAEIHSDRTLGQRRDALEGFKNGRYRVLVATDIAARGIDVKGIELVVNYDLPDDVENYIHRIGRTGRAGREGKAIAFATPDQGGDVHQIERIMKKNLEVRTHPQVEPERFSHRPGAGPAHRAQRPQGPGRSNRPFRPGGRPQHRGPSHPNDSRGGFGGGGGFAPRRSDRRPGPRRPGRHF